jgi:DNA-binding NtrC family response regulator
MKSLSGQIAASPLGSTDRSAATTPCTRPAILLLEDDAAINELLAHWTQSLGIRAVRAVTVTEATHLISDLTLVGSDFNGLLADYRLPDATGVRAIEEFMAAFPGRPIALMTAYHDLPLAIWARTRDIPIFLKPLDRAAVLAWLRAIPRGGAKDHLPR